MTKLIPRFGRLVTCLSLLLTCQLLSASSLRETPLVKAVQRAQTAVVNIHTVKDGDETNSVFGSTRRGKVNGMGTGIVIDARGYIVTNNHVVSGVDSLEISLANGSRYEANVVAYAPKYDLAVIKVDHAKDLEIMPMGTSSDLMLGETVIAVGNAFGYVHTVTAGIISSLSRDVEVNEEQKYENLIQTDASINPGNSGGPLLNLDGEVIGINVAIRAGAQRIGFAIPIDDARNIIARLMSIELMDRAYHGFVTTDFKQGIDRKLIIDELQNGSPADKAGFEPGDVVVKVNDFEIVDRVDLERSLIGQKQQEEIPVIVRRGEEELTISLTLGNASRIQFASGIITPNGLSNTTSDNDDLSWKILGMQLKKLPKSQRGVLPGRYRGAMQVTAVRDSSPADANGIRKGDLLVGLHVWETISDENVTYVLNHSQLKSFNPLKFYILRGSETLYGHLKIAAK